MKRYLFSLIMLSYISIPSLIFSLDSDKPFHQYQQQVWTAEKGMPMNTVLAIAQTQDGYLWLGSQSGLVRFDGVKFELFDHDNTPAITDDYIRALLVDKHGVLWIGTRGGGLVRYEEGAFNKFVLGPDRQSNNIRSLYESGDGAIWISTKNGLQRLYDNKITRIEISGEDDLSDVRSVCEDSNGDFWIGTISGVIILTKTGDRYVPIRNLLKNNTINAIIRGADNSIWVGTGRSGLFLFRNGNRRLYDIGNGLSTNFIMTLYKDRNNTLWVGTFGEGLTRITGNKIVSYNIEKGFISNSVYSIFEDKEGSLWVGTWGGGLCRLSNSKIASYTGGNGISFNVALSVFEDSKGNIWIGTQGDGAVQIKNGRYKSYSTRNGLSSNTVFSIMEYPEGDIWFGTWKGGISRLKNGKLEAFTTRNGLSNDTIRAMYRDSKGNFWVGSGSGGLDLYKGGGRFEQVANFDYIIISISEDLDGNLLIGTQGGGLGILKDGNVEFLNRQGGFNADLVTYFFRDKEKTLWIGTHGSGLYRYKNDTFDRITKKDGLPDNSVYSIFEDDNGSFWMSCNRGIFSINRNELDDFINGRTSLVKPQTFGTDDGMKSIVCNGGNQPSGLKSRDGELWFPTSKGVSVINPSDVWINTTAPPVVIENIIADRVILPQDIDIEIPPGTSNLEINYTGLSFIAPQKVFFKYKLDGFDKKWNEAGNRRTAYYTGLSPGSYRFLVKARNNDGIWCEQVASLEFYVRPVFYQAWWFNLIIITVVLLAAFGVHRLRIYKLNKRKDELEEIVKIRTRQLKQINIELEKANKHLDKKVKERTNELEETNRKLIHAARVKNEFIANVSHELRTPLASILGYTEILQRNDITLKEEKRNRWLAIIYKQGENLLSLVSSLLDINAMESGAVELKLTKVDINKALSKTAEWAISRLEKPDREIILNLDDNISSVYLDADKVRQVIQSLVDNAIKFSPGEKEIEIKSKLNEDEIKITVSDKGIGIPSGCIKSVFNPFYQVDTSSTRTYGGAGLGLYIAKSFVELHHGRIWVKSNNNKGTVITFCLPVDLKPIKKVSTAAKKKQIKKSVGITILVIDDNKDVAELVKIMLGRDYKIDYAGDGKEGVRKSLEVLPSLILMDLAMPVLNGYEATKILKAKNETKDIPIIALSARTSPDEVKRAIQAGCSAHLAKPFNTNQIIEAVKQFT